MTRKWRKYGYERILKKIFFYGTFPLEPGQISISS
jgi:hypothetical protein